MRNDKWTQTFHLRRFLTPRILGFLAVFVTLSACSENDENSSINLSSILAIYNDSQLDEVIACAASDKSSSAISHIYYYPIPEAFNVQYFETANTNVDPNNFSNYHLKSLSTEDVFGGYLKRFVRSGSNEVFSIVTFETEGKFHKSNPIRLKQTSQPTEYHMNVMIDESESLMPIFTWSDGMVTENAIYFQVISDENNEFISGTYTFDLWFQYYRLSNVVLNINRNIPESLISQNEYHFSMLAVSLDNWVNLIIEKPFVAQ